MPQVKIKLSWIELISVGQLAAMRSIQHLKDGDRSQRPKDTSLSDKMLAWGYNAYGLMGEMAVAKYAGYYWNGGTPRVYSEADVGKHIEIRTTQFSNGNLILFSHDKDDSPYVLVLADPPDFIIAGWLCGRDGKRPEYWREQGVRSPSFWVPQSALKPIAELISCST